MNSEVSKIKVPIEYGGRKHSVCQYELDTDMGKRLVYIDLTLLRKSKMYDSVPLYRLLNDGTGSLCAIRSAKWLHENGIY